MIKKYLNKLSHILKNIGFDKISQEVNDIANEWDEPWHEEAVKEFGENIEDVTEKEFFGETDLSGDKYDGLEFLAMEKEGFKPYGTMSDDYIGEGVYGTVYDGVYNGKDAVMKISKQVYDYSQDHEIWDRIIKARESMPKEFAKHIPEIYKYGKSVIKKGEFGMNYDFEYIYSIMERLYPLSEDITDELTMSEVAGSSSIELLKDEEYLYEVSKTISKRLSDILFVALQGSISLSQFDKNFDLEKAKRLNGIIVNDVDLLSPEAIFKILLPIKLTPDNVPGYVKNVIRAISEYCEQHNLDNIKRHLYGTVLYTIVPHRDISTYSYFYKDQSTTNAYTPFWESDPKYASLLKMLRFLVDNHNVKWTDLHKNNLMMDKDGNIKIVDIGEFLI